MSLDDEECQQWIESKVWEKVNAEYPDDSQKANEYFVDLMDDDATMLSLQVAFHANVNDS